MLYSLLLKKWIESVNIYKKNTEPLIQYFKDLSLLEYIDADRDLKTISSEIKQKMA